MLALAVSLNTRANKKRKDKSINFLMAFEIPFSLQR